MSYTSCAFVVCIQKKTVFLMMWLNYDIVPLVPEITILLFTETCSPNLSHLMTKPTKWHVRQAKTQISLGIRPVWSESSLSAWRKLGPLAPYWAHSEDSDQTGRMPRLIWVFAECTCHFVGFVMRRLICLCSLNFKPLIPWNNCICF